MSVPVSQELLDVVDAEDRVVDIRTRGDIHRLGLMHRSVHILLFNRKGELFIQKRSMSKDSNPGLWDSSAAGHVNSGEDYLDCAIRELGEELGIYESLSLTPLRRLPASHITAMEHCTVYHCVYDGPLVLQEEEIAEGAWVSITEMGRRVAEQDSSMTPILKYIWTTAANAPLF